MWNQTEINRLLASIAHTIPPMTEEGFEKVEEWYNRGLPTTKQWTARQLFKKYKQLTTGDATGQGGGLSSNQSQFRRLGEICKECTDQNKKPDREQSCWLRELKKNAPTPTLQFNVSTINTSHTRRTISRGIVLLIIIVFIV